MTITVMKILFHEISRSSCVAPSVTPNVDKDLLSPRILRPRRLSKKETKIKKRKPESVEDDGPQYGEPDIVSKEEWEEQEWNKTRELREVRASILGTAFPRITTLLC